MLAELLSGREILTFNIPLSDSCIALTVANRSHLAFDKLVFRGYSLLEGLSHCIP